MLSSYFSELLDVSRIHHWVGRSSCQTAAPNGCPNCCPNCCPNAFDKLPEFAIRLHISNKFGLKALSPDFGPDFGPVFGPVFGPAFGPTFGPAVGPDFGPDFGPATRSFGSEIGVEVSMPSSAQKLGTISEIDREFTFNLQKKNSMVFFWEVIYFRKFNFSELR